MRNRYESEIIYDRMYRVDWFNDQYEDTELLVACSESEAEEMAEELIPEDAIITNVRVA